MKHLQKIFIGENNKSFEGLYVTRANHGRQKHVVRIAYGQIKQALRKRLVRVLGDKPGHYGLTEYRRSSHLLFFMPPFFLINADERQSDK